MEITVVKERKTICIEIQVDTEVAKKHKRVNNGEFVLSLTMKLRVIPLYHRCTISCLYSDLAETDRD